MNRIDFTHQITTLLFDMIGEGETPIIDYVKRSPEEQNRLFKLNLSKCDGYRITSQHQVGKAMDIYFIKDGALSDPIKGWDYWHNVWEKLGGDPMIEWDKGHFEG